MVAASVVVVRDGRLLHAEHFADERPEHRRRPSELPAKERPELFGLGVRRRLIQEDPHPPVALTHDRGRVQEKRKAQAANVDAVDLA
jgi:hypothetical protein